jgi:hypothetical protein
MRTRCSERLALAGVAGALAALALAGPGAATTHTIPPGRVAAARQLLQEAEKRAAGVPAGRRAAYRLGVAALRARLGDVDEGLRALAAVPPPYDFSMREAVQEIAAAQAVRGDVAGALAHVAALAHGPDAQAARQAVAAALARAGRQADALGVVGHARDDLGRDGVLAAIVVARLEAGDRPAAALAALHSARGAVGPQSTMLEAYLLARDGKASQAHRLAAGVADDTWLFGFVQRAHAQARAGDLAGARATAGHIPAGDLRESGQAAIASGQARGGDVAAALATAGRLPEPTRSLAHTDIAIVQAERGDVSGALRTAALIQIPGNQAQARVGIARASARAGDGGQALRIARSVSFADYGQGAIKAVVEAQAERGDVAGAMATIATLPADERRGLELAVALARAEAGDAKPLLELFSAHVAASPLADVYLLGTVTRLLRIPAEDPTTSPFWALDVHPFQPVR